MLIRSPTSKIRVVIADSQEMTRKAYRLLLASEPTIEVVGVADDGESAVLSFMAKGYSNPAIAEALSIQRKTVEYHINNIFSKLHIPETRYHARVQAVLTFLDASGQTPQEVLP